MKRNIPFEEAIKNCGATFLRYDSTPLLCYRAAKDFVDAYEHEQRHEAQAVPVNWSVERDNAYHDLTEAIFKREPLLTIQKAAETFVDICNREERRKQERETPKNGEVYRDIFGNKYVIVGEEFLDGKQTCIAMLSFDCKDIPTVTNFFAVPLEQFMNPKFTKV